MNKQEAIEKIKSKKIPYNCLSDYGLGYNEALDMAICIINQIDEPEKPVVPQFVADFYESIKDDFEYGVYELCVNFYNCDLSGKIKHWFDCNDTNPIQVLVNMHQFGYEVQKEKLYTVEIPNPNDVERPILYKNRDGKVSIIFPSVPCWREVKNAQLTESEIKQDFDWAWKFAKEVNNNE